MYRNLDKRTDEKGWRGGGVGRGGGGGLLTKVIMACVPRGAALCQTTRRVDQSAVLVI